MDAGEPKVEMYTPLSARDYLKVYDDRGYPGISEQCRGLLESMKQRPLIDMATLAQTWRNDSWGSVAGENGSVSLIDPKLTDSK